MKYLYCLSNKDKILGDKVEFLVDYLIDNRLFIGNFWINWCDIKDLNNETLKKHYEYISKLR
jgi:hypothetical protein